LYKEENKAPNSIWLRKNWLSELKFQYGLSDNNQQKRIQINTLNSPAKDLFTYIRTATNFDLLQQPLFIINDEK